MIKIITTLALLLTAGTSAYMSVYGLSAVFAAGGIAVILMGCGMELGKILTVVHLHRHWKQIPFLARSFYCLVAVALAVLTSFEITGYLAQSHAQGHQVHSATSTRLESLHAEETALRARVNVIDKTLAGLPAGYVSRRLAERSRLGYDRLQDDLAKNLQAQTELRSRQVSDTAYTAPVFAVARTMGINAHQAATWFILALVAILEPLSIGLTVAASAAWVRRKPAPIVVMPSRSNGDAIIDAHDLSPDEVMVICDTSYETARRWVEGREAVTATAGQALARWASVNSIHAVGE